MTTNTKYLKDIEQHLDVIASSISDVVEQSPWSGGDITDEAVDMAKFLKSIAQSCEDKCDGDAYSLKGSLDSIACSLREHRNEFGGVDTDDMYNMSITLGNISASLKTLVELKQEKQRRHDNGLNYSPSPKHSKYLKRSLTKTVDGRKVSGKITFSRTGKRLFIQNRHGYTSA